MAADAITPNLLSERLEMSRKHAPTSYSQRLPHPPGAGNTPIPNSPRKDFTMFKDSRGGVKPAMKGNSAKVHMAVGSGSRPNSSKIGIPTSAPANAHSLDSRMPPGALK